MYENPFVECTARDMEYIDVVKYWCSPFSYYQGLDQVTLFNNRTPILIEGARGSGKTMILKYLSYFCQREEALRQQKGDFISYFKKTGSIGFYYGFRKDFGKLLNLLNCPESIKESLFTYYFQLYYAREIANVLNDLKSSSIITSENELAVLQDVNSLFETSCSSFSDAIVHINKKIVQLDHLIKEFRYLKDVEKVVRDLSIKESYINALCGSIKRNIHAFGNIKFLILIDEYENLSGFQRVVNTYLKQVEASEDVTYRIGFRPEGIDTYATSIGSEFLQINRDYLLVSLKNVENKKFQLFLKDIANKRLASSAFFKQNNLHEINKILGTREDWEAEAREAVKRNPQKHFELLNLPKASEADIHSIIDVIKYPENPLIEMLNILWINRGHSAEETASAMRSYLSQNKNKLLEKDKLAYKYMLDYSMKYKYSLLFVLLSKHSTSKKYYSFTTFSYLASGSVNDFISLCRNVVARLDDKCIDELLSNNPIPVNYQNQGAQAAALEQLDKIRLCEDNGNAMYTFIMNIGGVFETYHKDPAMQYPETNQFAFENDAEIYQRALLNSHLRNMIKWGVIVKRQRKQGISIGRRKGDLYYIDRLISPIFEISYRTRGGFNFVIKTDLYEKMLNNSMEPKQIISDNKAKETTKIDTEKTKVEDGSEQISFLEGEKNG